MYLSVTQSSAYLAKAQQSSLIQSTPGQNQTPIRVAIIPQNVTMTSDMNCPLRTCNPKPMLTLRLT